MSKKIEKGVWIVYDLEANRKIQELLSKEKFVFRFDSNLSILKKETLEKVDGFLKERLFINEKSKLGLYRFMDFKWEEFKKKMQEEK